MSFNHSILDSGLMWNLYRDSVGYEAFVKKFWTKRYTSIVERSDSQLWVYSTEQYPHNDIARNQKLLVDGLLERYVPHQDVKFAVVVVENKKENQTAGELEEQAANYAQILCAQNGPSLPMIYVHTNMGKTFRLWSYENGSRTLKPLFGGSSGTRAEYVDIQSVEASGYWEEWTEMIFGSPVSGDSMLGESSSSSAANRSLAWPVQYSPHNFTPQESSSSPPAAADSAPRATLESCGIIEVYNILHKNSSRYGKLTICNYLDNNGQVAELSSNTESWVYNSPLGAYVFDSNRLKLKFGYYSEA